MFIRGRRLFPFSLLKCVIYKKAAFERGNTLVIFGTQTAGLSLELIMKMQSIAFFL